ncbi:DNA-binding transcriptional activator GcvA [Roseovarius sp. A-2]|uniref:LysR family transcriptional regulator n=1 Tax=Roseovarius sp. A-2 TaxID=1570360 RepID=UPI0009B533C6|nr:LysR family transcriptional regulator [Roseovarius sp. A-2]GAW34937.1 DNA-binding transcriptional activator GcvA [Roseovarius sp. A-2]
MPNSSSAPSFARIYDDLRVVLTVQRCGSMTSAASEIGTTTSTVSRQIARLRDTLGIYPFVKSEGEWRLNPALSDLVATFEQADGMLESELARLQEYQPTTRRDVKIGAPPTVLSHILAPGMRDFVSKNAGIRPVLDSRIHESGLGSTDISVVFHPPESGRVRVKRCGVLHFSIFAPEGWREGDGWVSLGERIAGPYIEARRHFFTSDPTVLVDSFPQAVRMMRELGLAGALPVILAADTPEFRPLGPRDLDIRRDLYVIHHESRSTDPDIRATVDWVSAQLVEAKIRTRALQDTQQRLCGSMY